MDGEVILVRIYCRKRGCERALEIALLLGGLSPLCAQTLTAGQTVAITISPAAKLNFIPAALTLLSSGSFSAYSGSMTTQNEIRTSPSGAGSVTLQVTSEFSPTTGPRASVGDLSYQCTAASYGTVCSGIVTASGSSQTPIAAYSGASCTGGGSGCSNTDPNSVNIRFSVADKSSFKTGNYTATITLSMSAT